MLFLKGIDYVSVNKIQPLVVNEIARLLRSGSLPDAILFRTKSFCFRLYFCKLRGLSLCGIKVKNMGFANYIMIPSILHLEVTIFFLTPTLLVVVGVGSTAHLPVRRSWRPRCTPTGRSSTSRGTAARLKTRAPGGDLALVVIDREVEGRAITDHAQLIPKVSELLSV